MKNALGRLVSGISGAFEMNEAFLSGSLDVIVIRHADGTYHASPFHVRFGKLKLLRSREKIVSITVNGVLAKVTMTLGKAGEAYFIDGDIDEDTESIASPPTSPGLFPERSPSTIDIQSEEEKNPEEVLSPTNSSATAKWYAPWRKHQTDSTIVKKSGIFSSIFTIFHKKKAPQEKSHEGLALSLCLDLITSEDCLEKIFEENIVSPEVFSVDPWSVLSNPNLLLRINGKYCNWEKAAPILVSMIAYKSLAEDPRVEVKDSSPPLEPLPTKKVANLNKTLILSSEKLQCLGLVLGLNTVVYEVNSRLQGVQQVYSRIFLWDWTSRIVISDIDGTITKSDVLGQIFPMVGKDWTHAGVAQFYTDMTNNGYKILYLTSRAIGQAKTTKEYLDSVVQQGSTLPDGPLITSPDRLFKSFVREVIERAPHKFKAEKLREVAWLFPEERNPFYAGFGNRDTDAIAYSAAGVPLNKIFIINTESRIFVYNNTYTKTYTLLNEIVYEMFPPVNDMEELADSEYSALNYWKPDYLHMLEVDI